MLEISLSPQYKNLTEGTRDKHQGYREDLINFRKKKSTSVQITGYQNDIRLLKSSIRN